MARDLRLRLNREELRRLYISEKKSLEDIARLYGSSRVAVWKYCKSEHIIRRGRSDARLEAQKKGKVPQNFFDINDKFFSKWSSEMAYVLGLIATDGCVSKSGAVSLCINDKDLLEKVKNAMGSAHTIKYYGRQNRLYSFNFSRQRLCADLGKLGIFPNKSLNIRFPDVPDAFLIDFIRGVFDGDGSVFFEKRSPEFPLRTSFVSSSREFITELESKLATLGMPKKNIWQQPTKNSFSFILRYAHKDSIKLFRILYPNPLGNSLFLKRKHERFLQGSQLNGKTAK
ncbi:MAG: LAGLIDADG family homing endonuclease [Candidatus Omnitrophota bacterium]|jgi:hypothetical protein